MRPDLERDYVEFVSARLPRLHRTAYLLCGDPHQADDIVQAAVTSLYLHWKRAASASLCCATSAISRWRRPRRPSAAPPAT